MDGEIEPRARRPFLTYSDALKNWTISLAYGHVYRRKGRRIPRKLFEGDSDGALEDETSALVTGDRWR